MTVPPPTATARAANGWRRLLFACLALVLAACEEAPDAPALLERAEQSLAAGDDNAALIDTRAALQQAPEDPRARRILAEIELWRQRPLAALEEIERAAANSSDPDILVTFAEVLVAADRLSDFDALIEEGRFAGVAERPRYLASLALAQARWGEPELALATARTAYATAPENPRVATALALLQLRGEMSLDEAIESLQTVTDANPRAHSAISMLGLIQVGVKDYEGAAESFRQAYTVNRYRVRDRMLRVSALMGYGDFDAADAELQQLDRLVPDSADVAFLRSKWHLRQGEYESAIEAINPALAVRPKSPSYLLVAAMANTQQGNLETARRQWLNLDQAGHFQPGSKYQLARVQARLGETAPAVRNLRLVLETDPMNLSALRLLAGVLALQGSFAESMQLYEQVLDLEPDSARNLVHYSDGLSRAGDREAAVEKLQAARDLDPDSAVIRARLTTLLMAEARIDEAQAEVDAFLAARPDDAAPHALAGRLAHTTDDAAAKGHYEDALERDPGNRVANTGLADLALALDDRDEAMRRYEAILEDHPGDVQALMNIASIHARAKNFAEFEAALNRAIDANPDALDPRLVLARYYTASQRSTEAIRLLAGFQGDGRDDPRRYTLLAGNYTVLGDTSSAVDAAERLQQVNPDVPAGYVLAARALGKAGKRDAAADYLRKALAVQDLGDVRAELITVLLLDGRTDAARKVLREAAPDTFSPAQLALIRGQIEAGGEDLVGAARYFQQAYDLEPSESTAVLLAKTRWRAADAPGAIAALDAWLERDPNSQTALARGADYRLSIGDDAGALPLLMKLNAQAPNQPAILNNMAWASRDSQPEKGLVWIEEALQAQPDSVSLRDTHSVLLAATGQASEALALNDTLIREAPDKAGLVVSRARILRSMGRRSEAIQLLESLLARSGDVGGARELLADIKASP